MHLLPADVLGALADTEHWLSWTRHFGPVSGFEAKLDRPRERYVAAVFCYGCGLGPSQAARSLKGLDRRHVAHVNGRHMTEASLDDAITGVIDAYARIGLSRHWGSGETASADGMRWDVHPESLKSSYHLRYGGCGGIGYYLVSDTYIALFSRFLACGIPASSPRRSSAGPRRKRRDDARREGGDADVDLPSRTGLPARPPDEPGRPIHSAKTTVLARLWLRDAWCWLSDAPASVRGALT